MVKALYAGSFDPVTFGHVDIIQRAAEIFDQVVVAVSINTHKKAAFTPEQRATFIQQALGPKSAVQVIVSEELTVNLAHRLGASVLIRGIRGSADLDSEMAIAGLNSGLAPKIQTVFLPTAGQFRDLSSSMIKEIAKFHGHVTKFVPETVAKALAAKY